VSIPTTDPRQTPLSPAIPPIEALRGESRALTGEPRPRRVDVLVIDEDHAASYSLWALLRWRGVGVRAAAAADALGVAEQQRPALCLVSAALGPRFVFGLTLLPDAPHVLVHAVERVEELVGVAVLAGAMGVVWRYGDPDELAAEIRSVTAGRVPAPELGRDAVRRLLDRVEDRDRPLAAMLLMGIPRGEIARTLGISERALRARRWEIVKRLEPPGDRRVLTADTDRRG
jgi:two-component system, NarL family, nitrate/nitrite response regulator NarL